MAEVQGNSGCANKIVLERLDDELAGFYGALDIFIGEHHREIFLGPLIEEV